MRALFRHPVLLVVVRWFLGLVFIIAGTDKIAQPEVFAISIDAYKLLPAFSVNVFALVVPWVELISGIFLLAGVFLRGSSLMVVSLLSVFTVAVLAALLRGLQIDCGCFGAQYGSPIGISKILEDLGMLLLALLVYFGRGEEPADRMPGPSGPSAASLHSD
jgi:putative oxidoreductase